MSQAKKLTPEEEFAYQRARKAVADMERYRIAPTTENYALWFLAAGDENSPIAKEIRQIANQDVAFTADVSVYLRNKYMPAPESSPDALGEETQNVLNALMKMANQFTGDAAVYHTKINQQTSKLAETVSKGESMEKLLKDLVIHIQEIRASGADFSAKIAESRKEVEMLRTNLEKVTAEARRDFLTGINNRRAFDEIVSEQAELAERNFKDLCLLMIDIDHFKQFNDNWGHQTGDEVLKVVAKALNQNVRGSDIVARYGGEEFVVLLPGTPMNGARVVAENIRKTISASKLKRRDSQDDLGQITVSIGVARMRVGEGDTVPFLLQRADEALYSAKKSGRNRVVAEV